MELIRRIAFLGSHPVGLDPGPSTGGSTATTRPSGRGIGSVFDLPGTGLAGPGLMAANLIRQHRDELAQASTGALDHMVIDVVSGLFDQILSDPKVPPQMARQIARLQLPVLRVALGDVTFFSSRRHPVRRFVNRIASLACAFEDFSEGPGLAFILQVRDLVQQIVEGDFDQMELYDSKLDELEQFIAKLTAKDMQAHGSTATLLDDKDHELRLQQRYMQLLKAALGPLPIPEFMRDFIAQVWSQAVMRTAQRDGAEAQSTQRFRRAARELVMSVQPKGSPTHRKAFLMKLPQLMKDLNEGLNLIGWPEAAKKEFFATLLPAHAESLKGEPLSELSYNMLVKDVDAALAVPVPAADDVVASRHEALPELTDTVLENRFSAEEAQQVGLVAESASRLGRHGRYRNRRRHRTDRARHQHRRPASRRIARAHTRQVTDGSHPAWLRIPDAPQRLLAEGSAEPRQPRARVLRVHARQEAPGNDLDDVAHARPHVRNRTAARVRERLPDRARDCARAQATGRAVSGHDPALISRPQ